MIGFDDGNEVTKVLDYDNHVAIIAKSTFREIDLTTST